MRAVLVEHRNALLRDPIARARPGPANEVKDRRFSRPVVRRRQLAARCRVCVGMEVASSNAQAVASTAIADHKTRRLMCKRGSCAFVAGSPGAERCSSYRLSGGRRGLRQRPFSEQHPLPKPRGVHPRAPHAAHSARAFVTFWTHRVWHPATRPSLAPRALDRCRPCAYMRWCKVGRGTRCADGVPIAGT